MRYDYQPINLELVTLHIVISKILQEVLNIKAANCILKDLCNYNRQKRPRDIQNFFILLEVYGHSFAVNYFEPTVTPLTS